LESLKLLELSQENRQDNDLDSEKDPREYPRRAYHKQLILSYKNQKYKAELKNISRGGVFIKTGIQFKLGKQIRMAVPGSEIRKGYKLKGRVVRTDTEGFGVQFDDRSDRDTIWLTSSK
jgi:Tfp pilus assembly protein PilZ